MSYILVKYFFSVVAFSARYGPGSGPIYFTRVSCNGDEKSIFNCTYSTQTAGFSHFFDAGVKCYNKTGKYYTSTCCVLL